MSENGKLITPKDLFAPHAPNVFTMPTGAPFLTCLAKGLRASLGDDLPSAMILLPTRRAARDLTDAFLQVSDGRATLLPLMRTLADMDENEPPFAPGDLEARVAPAINSVRHSFELARMVAAKMNKDGAVPDAAGALAMSAPLASLLSDLAMEELPAHSLSALDENLEALPEHFQDAAVFVQIVAKFWPAHLKELGLSEPMARRVALLGAACDVWAKNPPNHPVIIAGSTGTLGATARLIKTVSQFPRGLIVLPGLDTHINGVSFEDIDDQHPQASLKNLLTTLGLTLADVPDFPGANLDHKARMRARILSESLIPAQNTSDWPARIARINSAVSAGNPMRDGLSGLSLIEAKTDEEEAGVIALIMRETLDHTGKTCALVTPDPALARRVRARLTRWGVAADSSAGEPLEETAHGTFLAHSLELALDPFDPQTLTALVKHKLFARDGDEARIWDTLETHALRGVRATSYEQISQRLEKAKVGEQGLSAHQALHEKLAPLDALRSGTLPISKAASAHVAVLENLAGGVENLWSGEAGEKAASMMEELISYGDILPPVDGPQYIRLLSQMMRGRVVRPRYGTEERLQILGPLEARMLEADTIILGGLNEGVWPAAPSIHPILSRGMRQQIGLSAPERRFGLAAHDFEGLAAKKNVILTRSQRTADGPAVQSRWLWRLTTLARGALGGEMDVAFAPEKPWLAWARALDKAPDKPRPAAAPEPRPPANMRWPEKTGGRKLSVTQVSKLIRDPYGIYARHVLGILPLEGLDMALGPREYGIAVHEAFDKFSKGSKTGADYLLTLLKDELKCAGFENHSFARHNIRLAEMADWMAAWMRTRKEEGWALTSAEKYGRFKLEDINFTLSGMADRIEKQGSAFAVIDYKTGGAASNREVAAGFDPQLPLLAYMLENGAFGKAGTADDLLYIKPRQRDETARVQSLCAGKNSKPSEDYVVDAIDDFKKLIMHFDDKASAYYSQPRSKYVNPYGDYDQLARRAEWAAAGDGEEGGGS